MRTTRAHTSFRVPCSARELMGALMPLPYSERFGAKFVTNISVQLQTFLVTQNMYFLRKASRESKPGESVQLKATKSGQQCFAVVKPALRLSSFVTSSCITEETPQMARDGRLASISRHHSEGLCSLLGEE